MPLLNIQRPRHYFIEYDTVGLSDEMLEILFNTDISKGEPQIGKLNLINGNDHIINDTVQSTVLDKQYKYAVLVNILIHSKEQVETAKNHFSKYGAALMKIQALNDYQLAQNTISKLMELDPLESYINSSFAKQFVVQMWYFSGKTTQLLDIADKKMIKYESFIKKTEKVEKKQKDATVLDNLTFNLKLTEQELDTKNKVILPHQQPQNGAINYVPDEFDDFDSDDEIDLDGDLDF